ncbi:AAA family ATPase [Paenibacillus glycinis]|uniref:AAA family ATPase n=1 Tax=Paenibacillus glycinis TaxID=2697035 RepID=A0ABW9XYQ5_9BACL|nr:AAA family ATPase [Paenibacillus glycinis]NBD27840.1 AAA family ATPase [Paenibacillus glycinis]
MNGPRTGLTLGKFAPLHRGHQFMIETAIRETDEVIVVIYDCPDTTDVPLHVRADWIRSLYPGVQVVEAWDGPSDMGDTPEIKRLQENYILGLLNGRNVTHFYSSEFYGEHMSIALGAENRQVDPARLRVPVSGTKIRQAPYENRSYLDPLVYRDLVAKIVFLGAPSTGKTTLAAHMAERLNTAWMPEYGREYWERHQVERRLSPRQLEEIAVGHVEREDRMALEARELLFVDTNALTTQIFSMDYHGEATAGLTALADRAASRYDLVFLCGDDIPYDDTWDRSGDVHRAAFQKRFAADLHARRIPYVPLRGTLEERAEQVTAVLRQFRKYRNPSEWLGAGLGSS